VAGATPFSLRVPDDVLGDLQARLARVRWPDEPPLEPWSTGTSVAYLKQLVDYWRTGFDWRAQEARLNALRQFKVPLGGIDLHYIHEVGRGPAPMPLLLSHGWPGSVVEFLEVIGPLTDPAGHGGDPADAFHVVCPSLPGYGFSDRPSTTGWGVERTAAAWAELMARLGYDRYGAQGGDWGAMVTTALGQHDPDHVVGVHVNMPVAPPPPDAPPPSEAELAALAVYDEHRRWGTGYSKQQSTRPQTLGYGLVDSPAGQCAWIVEKFQAWTDCDGHPENALTRDQLLDNVMLYWLPGTGASSARMYWESFVRPGLGPVEVPSGCSIFPGEIARLPRAWIERRFTDLRWWNELDRGGHFAAFEQPSLFVDEVRSFFRLVR
jgi:epoxide hydrolase